MRDATPHNTLIIEPGTPVADQWHAATDHAASVIHRVGDQLGVTVHPDRSDLAHAAIVSPLHRVLLEWRSGPWADACGHVGHRLRPVGGLLTHPRRLYCAERRCVDRAAKAAAKADPDHCDACQAETRIFREVQIGLGPCLVAGNICGWCWRRAEGVSR